MRKNNRVRDLVLVGLFAAVIAVCSWISVPGPVPFTLQTMGVFLSVALLGGKRGTAAVAAYILLGALGVPVFSGFSGGISHLLGVTGGYIIGFFFSALAMWALEKAAEKKHSVLLLSMLLGLLVCYLFGSVWFQAVYSAANGAIGFAAVLGTAVIPFVPVDLLKIAAAYLLCGRLKRLVDRG